MAQRGIDCNLQAAPKNFRKKIIYIIRNPDQVCGGSAHTLRRAIPSVHFRCSAAHSAYSERDSLAHGNTRSDTCHASEPALAFAASHLTYDIHPAPVRVSCS